MDHIASTPWPWGDTDLDSDSVYLSPAQYSTYISAAASSGELRRRCEAEDSGMHCNASRVRLSCYQPFAGRRSACGFV